MAHLRSSPFACSFFLTSGGGRANHYTSLIFLLSGGLKSLILCMLFISIFVPQIVTEGTWTSIRARCPFYSQMTLHVCVAWLAICASGRWLCPSLRRWRHRWTAPFGRRVRPIPPTDIIIEPRRCSAMAVSSSGLFFCVPLSSVLHEHR